MLSRAKRFGECRGCLPAAERTTLHPFKEERGNKHRILYRTRKGEPPRTSLDWPGLHNLGAGGRSWVQTPGPSCWTDLTEELFAGLSPYAALKQLMGLSVSQPFPSLACAFHSTSY